MVCKFLFSTVRSRHSVVNASLPHLVGEVMIESEFGKINWKIDDSEIIRIGERIAVISAGGLEYLERVKRIGRHDYSTVTAKSEMWQGENCSFNLLLV